MAELNPNTNLDGPNEEGGEEGHLEAGDEGAEGGEEGHLEAGDEGAEGGEEGHLEAGDEGVQPTRGQSRQQRLANERNQEREARIQAEAEAKLHREQAEFYRRQAEAAQQQRQTPPAEQVYEDPDEKWRRETQATMNRGLQMQADLADKANFTLAAVKDPLKAKLMDKVEAEVQKLRLQGNMQVTREGLFHYLLGVETAANYGKKTPTAAAAEQRVARAKTTPAPSRSNVARPAGGQSLEARLLDQAL